MPDTSLQVDGRAFFILKFTGFIKPLQIMANVKIAFMGTEKSCSEEHELTCYINTFNEIYIRLYMGDNSDVSYICFDKSTAIKFAKTLRTEINKIEYEK